MEITLETSERHCANCKIEIGGYFGNKVYRWRQTDLCFTCGEVPDPTAQQCIAQTGMNPSGYQKKYRRAWND